MEKKRWVLIFFALCLALAYSVSSVEAQCAPCEKCDRDGDTFIKDSRPCQRCAGPEVEFEDDDSDALFCVDNPDAVPLYRVTLLGDDWAGGPATWEDKTSGDGWLGLPVHNPGNMTLDLSYLRGQIPGGFVCFPEDGPIRLNAAQLIVKKIKGGGDLLQATGIFYFDGETSDPDILASYQLEVLGLIPEPLDWPGTQLVPVPDWALIVNTTTKGGRKIACTSEGVFDGFIDVEEIQPVDPC